MGVDFKQCMYSRCRVIRCGQCRLHESELSYQGAGVGSNRVNFRHGVGHLWRHAINIGCNIQLHGCIAQLICAATWSGRIAGHGKAQHVGHLITECRSRLVRMPGCTGRCLCASQCGDRPMWAHTGASEASLGKAVVVIIGSSRGRCRLRLRLSGSSASCTSGPLLPSIHGARPRTTAGRGVVASGIGAVWRSAERSRFRRVDCWRWPAGRRVPVRRKCCF